MAENKMKNVAKLLDLELEEEFKIDGHSSKYKLTENGLKRWLDDLQQWCISRLLEELLIGEKKIIKLPKPILDDVEREFLSSIIDSVKDRVIYIKRCLGGVYSGYIDIHLESYTNAIDGEIVITSSCFEKETMFNRMELERKYTLEELGL